MGTNGTEPLISADGEKLRNRDIAAVIPGRTVWPGRPKCSRQDDDDDYIGAMNGSAISSPALDCLLNSVSRCFDLPTARALAELRQDERVRRRMEELGAKASEGRLSAEEAREYDSLIEVSDVVATLQIKARRQVAAAKPA
jgi:hypothetical protein